MNMQEEHDTLVQKLQDNTISKMHRIEIAGQQYKLAIKLFIAKHGVKIIPVRKDKYRKNYIEGIYVNKAFDNISRSSCDTALEQLKKIRSGRISEKLSKSFF